MGWWDDAVAITKAAVWAVTPFGGDISTFKETVTEVQTAALKDALLPYSNTPVTNTLPSATNPDISRPDTKTRYTHAGYSTYEWENLTPVLRASFLADPLFGVIPIVIPGQVTQSPSSVAVETFLRGAKKDLAVLGDKAKGLVGIGGFGLAVGAGLVAYLYLGGGKGRG